MIAHHCMFPGTPKSLDYLASLHCDQYKFWKDDGKDWQDHKGMGEKQLWTYNCEDCVRTFEVMESQLPGIMNDPRLRGIWNFQQNHLVPLLFDAMCRGIRADLDNKEKLTKELNAEINKRNAWIETACGHTLNIRSPKQMQEFFYKDLGFRPIIKRGTGRPTTDDDALSELKKRDVAFRPLINRVQELRSLGVFLSTFVEARLDVDNRIRSSFNPCGTDTFRLSSSENAFWNGLNLQNIPGEPDEPDDPDVLVLPNIRKLFLPDEGYVIFDLDLDRADLQVVVWEANDEGLRQALELGIDLHLLNAGSIFNIKELNHDKLRDADFVKYAKEHYAKQRRFSKAWVHGTDYGGGDRTMAATVGITVGENKRYRERWFHDHPGIKAWHDRTEQQLKSRRFVENRFGYRFTFFDRIDGALPQALAWVPQSSVACVINRAWDNIYNQIPEIQMLIQVHDSLVGQFKSELLSSILPRIKEAAKIVIPYDRPLTIPTGIKSSAVSWGDCK